MVSKTSGLEVLARPCLSTGRTTKGMTIHTILMVIPRICHRQDSTQTVYHCVVDANSHTHTRVRRGTLAFKFLQKLNSQFTPHHHQLMSPLIDTPKLQFFVQLTLGYIQSLGQSVGRIVAESMSYHQHQQNFYCFLPIVAKLAIQKPPIKSKRFVQPF